MIYMVYGIWFTNDSRGSITGRTKLTKSTTMGKWLSV